MSISKISSNLLALGVNKDVKTKSKKIEETIAKLSTGLKINGAKDGATELAISERLRSQITGYEMANQNSMDAL